MSECPRCGEAVAAGQEYCLECGLRLPGRGRLGPAPTNRRAIAGSIALAGVVAVAGAALAIGLTRDTAAAVTIVTATGGSAPVPRPTVAEVSLATWPDRKDGWTNVLISIPKVEGRDAAVARADQARKRGLRDVGVLDSSKVASLHPGYWVVFSGVYASEPEAASRLREAKAVQNGARTERIVP